MKSAAIRRLRPAAERTAMMTPEIAAQTTAINALAQRYDARRLDLFGSATTGNFNAARSDVDFLVSLPALPPAEYADAYFGLHAALEDLLGRSVGLVTEDSVLNPYLRKAIDASRIPLYGV